MLCERTFFSLAIFKQKWYDCYSIYSANNSNFHQVFYFSSSSLSSATTTQLDLYLQNLQYVFLVNGRCFVIWREKTIEPAMIMFPIHMVSCLNAAIGYYPPHLIREWPVHTDWMILADSTYYMNLMYARCQCIIDRYPYIKHWVELFLVSINVSVSKSVRWKKWNWFLTLTTIIRITDSIIKSFACLLTSPS